jgi:hypothetical protein
MSSDYSIEIKNVSPTIWVYRDTDGKIKEREQSKEEREEQIVPPRGEYTLKVKAFAKPFEMTKSEQYGGGVQMMTRLLLEVVDGGKASLKGQQTTALCSLAISKNSNLGRVYLATTGKSIDQGGTADPTLMLEQEFQVYLKQDKLDDNGNRTRTAPAWETVAKVGESAEDDEGTEFQT